MSAMTGEESKLARFAIQRGGKEFAFLAYHSDWKWKEDVEGRRLAHMVAESGKVELARVLADAGHGFEEQDRKGRTPLLTCMMSGGGSEEMLDWLVAKSVQEGRSVKAFRKDGLVHGGGLHAETVEGWDALGYASRVGMERWMGKLISAGVNGKSLRTGDTALILAAGLGQVSSLRWLLKRDAELHAANDQGRTALWVACSNGRDGAARFLLDQGASWRDKDIHGMTALSESVARGHLGCVKELLKAGADPEWVAGPGSASGIDMSKLLGNKAIEVELAKWVEVKKGEEKKREMGLLELGGKLRQSREKAELAERQAKMRGMP